MQKCGGYRNFILRSKDLAVVDKIVAAKTDLRNAQELAFKVSIQIIFFPGIFSFQEIYNSLLVVPVTKNENVNSEVSKDIWNSKPNILSHSKVVTQTLDATFLIHSFYSHQEIFGDPSMGVKNQFFKINCS